MRLFGHNSFHVSIVQALHRTTLLFTNKDIHIHFSSFYHLISHKLQTVNNFIIKKYVTAGGTANGGIMDVMKLSLFNCFMEYNDLDEYYC